MRAVSFYHRETGILNGQHLIASDDNAVALNTPADHVAIDGHHDPLCRRVEVENPEIIDVYTNADKTDIPTKATRYNVVDHQPPQPSAEHLWCPDTRRWLLSPAAKARIASRAAARARIEYLEHSQHRFVRLHALGDPGARQRLEEIQTEIESLEMHLEEKQ